MEAFKMDLAVAQQRKKVKLSRSARTKKLSEADTDGSDMENSAAQPLEDVKLPTEAQLPITAESDDFWDELIIDGFAIASFKSAEDLQDWIRKTEETTKLEKFCREDQNENCRKRAKNPRKCKGNAKMITSNCCGEISTDGSNACGPHDSSPVNCGKLNSGSSLCDPDHNCNNCGSLSAKNHQKDTTEGDMVVKDEIEATTIQTDFRGVKLPPKDEITEEKEPSSHESGPISNSVKVTNGHRPSPSAGSRSPQPDSMANCQQRSDGEALKPAGKSSSPGKERVDSRNPKGVTADIQSQSAESQAKSQLTGVASQRPAGPDLSSFAVSAANMLSTTGLPTYLPNDSHQRQHGHVHSYPFPTALPTGIPTPSGVQQLFGLSGLNGMPLSSLNGLPGLGVTPFAAIPAAAGPVSMSSMKKRGKWCAMHVRIAWEIHRRQQELRQAANDGKPAGSGDIRGSFPGSSVSASAPLPTLNPPPISALSSGHSAHIPGVQSSSKFPVSSLLHSTPNGALNGYNNSAEIASRRDKLLAQHDRDRRERCVEGANGVNERTSRSYENGHSGNSTADNRDRSRSPFRGSNSATNLAALAHLSNSTQAALSAFNNVLNGPMGPPTPNGKERGTSTVGPEDGLLYRQHEILQERLKNERPEANKSVDPGRNSSGHHSSNTGGAGRSESLKHSMSNSFLSPAPPSSTVERNVKSVTPSSISSSAGRIPPYLYGPSGMTSVSQDGSLAQQFSNFGHLGLLASAGDPYRNLSAVADFQAMMAARQRSELSQQFASQSSYEKERQEMMRLELNAQILNSQQQSGGRGPATSNPLAPMIDWERLMSAGRMSAAPRGTPDPFLLACAGLGANPMLPGDRQGPNGADQRLMAELAERNKMLAAAASGIPNLDSFRAFNIAAQMGLPPGFAFGPNSLGGLDPNRNFAASLSALGPAAHLFPPGASQFAAMMAPPYGAAPAGSSASASKILEQLVRQKNGGGVKDGNNATLAQMAADLQSR